MGQTQIRCGRTAFTLIELLVVISIIVVLLALLTPALDRAIYQAMLAKDGAQMRAVAQGTLIYASENLRHFPGPASTWDAMQLRNGAAWDVPTQLESYVSIHIFVDPLLQDARIRVEECKQDPRGVFMPGYHWYTSWGTAAANLTPMTKIGERMIFDAPEGETRRFGIIMADRDARQVASNATSSHQGTRQQLWQGPGCGQSLAGQRADRHRHRQHLRRLVPDPQLHQPRTDRQQLRHDRQLGPAPR